MPLEGIHYAPKWKGQTIVSDLFQQEEIERKRPINNMICKFAQLE